MFYSSKDYAAILRLAAVRDDADKRVTFLISNFPLGPELIAAM